MPKGLLFWILMILWLVFGLYYGYPDRRFLGGTLLIFVLFFLLGWAVFGFVVQ